MIETRLMDRTDVNKPTSLADWLRLKMDKRGLKSARALAKYAGLSPDTVSRALHGVQPEPETITKLAVYFGVPRAAPGRCRVAALLAGMRPAWSRISVSDCKGGTMRGFGW